MRFQIRVVLWGLLLWTAPAGAADKLVASSGSQRVQLIELYSSESCSSCPPADAFVSTLQKKKGLWQDFVPVVFHVDYWNNLGWKDGLSSSLMTKRQVELCKQAGASVYTPGLMVDGHEWQEWRSTPDKLPSSPASSVKLSVFADADGSYRVQVSGLKDGKHYTVHLALLGMGLESHIDGGENSGRKLRHNFVILDWDGQPTSVKASDLHFTFKKSEQKTSRLAIATWIEEEGSLKPIQATGGYL